MPWDASHLYDFMIDGENYGDVPMDSSLPFQPLDAGTVDLANLVERKIKCSITGLLRNSLRICCDDKLSPEYVYLMANSDKEF